MSDEQKERAEDRAEEDVEAHGFERAEDRAEEDVEAHGFSAPVGEPIGDVEAHGFEAPIGAPVDAPIGATEEPPDVEGHHMGRPIDPRPVDSPVD
jgi:hypothetical protein